MKDEIYSKIVKDETPDLKFDLNENQKELKIYTKSKEYKFNLDKTDMEENEVEFFKDDNVNIVFKYLVA